MTKTIAELLNRNFDPIKHLGRNNPAIRELEDLMDRNLENLRKSLNSNEREILEKYNDCLNEYTVLLAEETFCAAFCIALRLSSESFAYAEQIL